MPATELRAGISVYGTRWRQAALAAALKIADHFKASIGFALVDQGMTSFANFAQFTIAGRLLPINEFGMYSIAWVSSTLVVFAATSLLVDPLPAITSVRRPSMRKPLLAAAVRLSVLLCCALAALMTIGGVIAWRWSPTLGTLLLCLAVTSPLQQLQYVSRRFCYLLRREAVAAASAAVYAAVLLGGVLALWATARFSASGLILLSGAASFAASAVGVARGCVPISKVRAPLCKWLAKQCWYSGRWLAGSSVMLSTSNFIILWITAVMFGPSATGILRAVSTLFMPIYQFASAMGSLLVPRVADVGASQSASRFRAAALQAIVTLGAVATAYSVVMLIWGSDLFVLVYNKPEITGVSGLLWPFSICAILDAVAAAAAFVLIANATTKLTFWARVASIAVFVPGALCLAPAIGLDAIVWAATAGCAASAFIHGLAVVRSIQGRSYGRMPDTSVGPTMNGA